MSHQFARRACFYGLWGFSFLSFAWGFARLGSWWCEAIPIALALAWLPSRGKGGNLRLCLSALVAAAGILLSAPAPFMVVGAAASLALWDFSSAQLPPEGEGAAPKALRAYARSRLPIALSSIGLGALAAILGARAALELPFFALALCVLGCAIAADLAVRYLKRAR
jgi:hypothetical protein